jgi:ketosteroid isomerase-like protein
LTCLDIILPNCSTTQEAENFDPAFLALMTARTKQMETVVLSAAKNPMVHLFALVTLLMAVHVSNAGAQSGADREAVLAVNTEFYRAFRESDTAAMANVWASQEPVAVQHPSTGRIDGRDAVLQSWSQIMRRPPDISCEVEAVRFSNGGWAVTCLEKLNPGSVRMINIFRKDADEWKMIYHGPAPEAENV